LLSLAKNDKQTNNNIDKILNVSLPEIEIYVKPLLHIHGWDAG
jgi:hypothetical protein